MPEEFHIGAAVAAAVRSIDQRQTLEATLSTIAAVTVTSAPGFDHVGISTIDRQGNVHTRAATSGLVWELNRLQYGLGQGPCKDTLRDAAVVVAPRIRDDQRWPRYVPEAVAAGLKSQLAVKLFLDSEGTMGGLNLYSTRVADIAEDAVGIADLFAAHAAVALSHAHQRDGLAEALHSRKVIGQAIGIIMERQHVNEDRAFDFLVHSSSHGNIKLRDIAARIVTETNAD